MWRRLNAVFHAYLRLRYLLPAIYRSASGLFFPLRKVPDWVLEDLVADISTYTEEDFKNLSNDSMRFVEQACDEYRLRKHAKYRKMQK